MSGPARSAWTAVLLVAGCGTPPPMEASLDSPVPAARLAAIVEAARRPEAATTRSLLESLDSDDAAVRMLAITTLSRGGAGGIGYDFADPPYRRRAELDAWLAGSGQTPTPAPANGPHDDDG